MGEKGIAADAPSAMDVAGLGATVVERTTTVVTSALQDVGEHTVETIRDKTVEHVIDEAHQRLTGDAKRRSADERAEEGPTPA